MSITKNVTWTFATKLVSYVIAFAASVFLTRLLGPEGKGVQAFIVANANLLGVLFGFNFVAPITYFIAKEKFSINKILSIAIILNIGSIALFFLFWYFLEFLGDEAVGFFIPEGFDHPIFFWLLFLLFINRIIHAIFRGFLQGKTLFKVLNQINIVVEILGLIIYFSTFLYNYLYEQQNLIFLFKVIFVLYALNTIIKLYVIVKHFEGKLDFNNLKEVTQSFFSYAMLGYFTALATFGMKRIDIWFVEYYQDISEVGYYSLAAGLTNNLLIGSLIPAMHVISPYITKSAKAGGIEILGRFSRILVFAIVIMGVVAIVIAPILVPLLYGEDFRPTVVPLQILTIGVITVVVRNIFSTYNNATNNLKPNLYANGLALGLTLILDFLLIPRYGIIGASIASVCAYTLSSYIIFRSVFKLFPNKAAFYFFLTKDDVLFVWEKIRGMINL